MWVVRCFRNVGSRMFQQSHRTGGTRGGAGCVKFWAGTADDFCRMLSIQFLNQFGGILLHVPSVADAVRCRSSSKAKFPQILSDFCRN